jgi:hypothetical protein
LDNNKVTISALALNGWQRITRVKGNSLMSWGTQVYIHPSDKFTFNYSSFLGTDKADSVRKWRIYHNVYAVFQFTGKLGVTAGFDFGTEQVNKGSNDTHVWYTPVSILRFKPGNNWTLAVRAEYFSDKNGVIIATGTPNGFKTAGFSLNLDRTIGEYLSWRTEFRTFRSKDPVFIKNNIPVRHNRAITTSLALAF